MMVLTSKKRFDLKLVCCFKKMFKPILDDDSKWFFIGIDGSPLNIS
jgi:hypothetical protein